MSQVKNINEVVYEKLHDAQFSGALVEFDPQEASLVGAFFEDALNEEAAQDSTVDLLIAYMGKEIK